MLFSDWWSIIPSEIIIEVPNDGVLFSSFCSFSFILSSIFGFECHKIIHWNRIQAYGHGIFASFFFCLASLLSSLVQLDFLILFSQYVFIVCVRIWLWMGETENLPRITICGVEFRVWFSMSMGQAGTFEHFMKRARTSKYLQTNRMQQCMAFCLWLKWRIRLHKATKKREKSSHVGCFWINYLIDFLVHLSFNSPLNAIKFIMSTRTTVQI